MIPEIGHFALILALLVAPCLAQDYPARPVHLVVPYTPGTGADILAEPRRRSQKVPSGPGPVRMLWMAEPAPVGRRRNSLNG